jgi:hypothetical protein
MIPNMGSPPTGEAGLPTPDENLSTTSPDTVAAPLTLADLSSDEHPLRSTLLQTAVKAAQDDGQVIDDERRHAIEGAVLAKIAEARLATPLGPVMASTLQQLERLDQQVDYAGLKDQIFQAEIEKEFHTLTVRDAARRRFTAAQDTSPEPRPPVRLDKLLLQPDEDPEYRIDGLHPTGGRVVILAPRKAGKSTLIGNVARCLVDDYPVLGRFAVEPVERLLIIDNELDVRTSKRWLRDQGILNDHRVDVLHLRGRTGTFNILDPQIRAQWARRCEGVDLAFFDCLRPVLDALGLSEDKDAGRFLVAFDALLAEAGIGEAIIVHHMGHNGERARGDSRIQDWPDAIWKIVAEDPEDHNSPRFFSAYGRDVNVPEFQLDYDAATRHLSYGGGSRKDGKIDGTLEAVVDFIQKSPGTSKTGIKAVLPGDDKVTSRAIDKAVQLGLLEERDRPGRGGGKAYYPTQVTRVNPSAPGF